MTAIITASKVMLAFTAWTVFTFLCHYSAKRFLSVFHPAEDDVTYHKTMEVPIWSSVMAFVLTFTQVSTCFIALRVSLNSHDSAEKKSNIWGYSMAIFTHFCATFTTNYSLAIMYAPSTLTIKLMEPIMSAMVVWLVTGKAVSRVTLLSLAILLVGSWGFVGNPLSNFHVGAGTLLAVISNFFYGIRNVIIKHILGGTNLSVCHFTEYITYIAITAASYWLYTEDNNGNWLTVTPLALVLMSGISHVLYSYISTCVILDYLSVVGHAVANIVKRLLVVVLMIAVGQKSLDGDR